MAVVNIDQIIKKHFPHTRGNDISGVVLFMRFLNSREALIKLEVWEHEQEKIFNTILKLSKFHNDCYMRHLHQYSSPIHNESYNNLTEI